MPACSLGPDLVIAGAARSGTSSLAAQLGAHPAVDPGKVKESNYFSRNLERGPGWYEGLYDERRMGLLRMDASTSYTSALHPEALKRLAAAAPDAFGIYVVRQPTERALSHYLYRHYYLQIDHAPDFGTALRTTSYYVDGSDYSRWLSDLRSTFADGKLLVVPFEVVTTEPEEATAEICRQLGLAVVPVAQHVGRQHRNDVVEYRNLTARRVASRLRRSPAYSGLRAALGSSRMRKARGLLTRQALLPSTDEAMASCDSTQLELLRQLDSHAGAAVREHLVAQDSRLGLTWAGRSFSTPDHDR